MVDSEAGSACSFGDGVMKELRLRQEGAAHFCSQKRDVCEEGGKEGTKESGGLRRWSCTMLQGELAVREGAMLFRHVWSDSRLT